MAIFRNQTESVSETSQPHVPKEIFEAAQRVIQSKSCELIKTRSGVYIVKFSENGPFPEKVGNDWLPVYVARLEKWSSGGIKREEMREFDSEFSVTGFGNMDESEQDNHSDDPAG